MVNRVRLVAAATGFSLLFEYSMRGIPDLVTHPYILLLLVGLYISFYVILDDLVRRFRLKDYHVLLLAFPFGWLYQALVNGSSFYTQTPPGINWMYALFPIVFWWGGIQMILALYLANRISPRHWNTPRLSRPAFWAAVVVNLFCVAGFQANPYVPRGQTLAYAILVVGIAGSALLLWWWFRKRKDVRIPLFQRSIFMDVMGILTVLMMLFSMFFLTTDPIFHISADVNQSALWVVSIWSILLGILILLNRILSKREISV